MTTTIRFAIRLALFAWFAYREQKRARWLPWWRRYLSLSVMGPWALNSFGIFGPPEGGFDWVLTIGSVAIDLWNNWTARNNEHDGNDLKAKEVAQAQLTDVEQRSFNRQTAEALS